MMNLRTIYRTWEEGIRAIVTQLSAFETANNSAIDMKADIASPTFTGTVTVPTPFTVGAVSVTATGTEMNYLVGVTSGVQAQINAKQASDTTLAAIADESLGAFSHRNKIINGNFDVWHRGTSFASGAAQYTADRFGFFRASLAAGATLSRQTGENSKYCARVQRDAANTSTNLINLIQIVEGVDMRHLAGKNVTVTFRARCGADYSATGLALESVIRTGTTEDEGGVSATATWAGVVSDTQTNTLTTTFQTFTHTAAIPSDARELALLLRATPTGTAGAADYYEVEQIQLEQGSIATPFENRAYAVELALCHRYARKQAYYIPATTAQNLGTIDMRKSPTISGGGAGFTSTGTTADQLIAFQTAGAVATLTLDAEL